jgi:predicted oxidoreductase
MDLTKLQAAVAELEAEAARCKRLAQELRDVIQRSASSSGQSLPAPARAGRQRGLDFQQRAQKSVLVLAVETLLEQQKPMHVDALVPLINAKRTVETNRAAVESQLVRAIKSGKHGVRRTAPGTFAVVER